MCRRGLDVDEGLEDAEDFAHFLRCRSNGVARAVAKETAAASRERRLVEVIMVRLCGGFEDVISNGAALGAGAFDAVGAGGGGGGGEGIVFVGEGGR